MTKHDTQREALLDDLVRGCESSEEMLGEHG